jgi:hypothetical protein
MNKTVRISEELYAKVKALAAKEQRSASNMLQVLLSEALAARSKS